MKAMHCYSCTRDDSEGIPFAFLEALGIDRQTAHSEARAIARISAMRMEQSVDVVCRVPFCVTVEAEAFGAAMKIPVDEGGPRCFGYRFSCMEQLNQLQPMDLSSGRIAEVLKSITILRDEGKVVVLNVEGPFTILGFLVDSGTIFRGIIKQRSILEHALSVLEASLVTYIRSGIRHGASIISYADPTGTIEIFGPDLYREVIGLSTYRILKQLEDPCAGALTHLCGQTSRSLERVGFCTAHPVEVARGVTYGTSLCQFVQAKTPAFIGHNCMKSSTLVLSRPTVWQIKLT